MAFDLEHNTYGKKEIRLTQVLREGSRHTVVELSVDVLFRGDFASSYRDGDNAQVLPTDTMKNSVYALARLHPVITIEEFARVLSKHFLAHVPELREVSIEVRQKGWNRIGTADAAFVQGGAERRFVRLLATRGSNEQLLCGFKGLEILKTSDSAFSGYRRDEWTTLPETRDRLLGTSLEAEWAWRTEPLDHNAAFEEVRTCLLQSFAGHKSESVQHTLFAMASALMEAFAGLQSIKLVMPNQHRILFELTRLGLDNPNQVFVATDQPFGYIEAMLTR